MKVVVVIVAVALSGPHHLQYEKYLDGDFNVAMNRLFPPRPARSLCD